MTQLVELRDGFRKFEDAGVKLYTISYDDREAHADFARTYDVRYRMLSDVDSDVIRAFGILNTQVDPGDGPLYGMPYPGTYVVDEDGVVVAKFFHDSYKKRDGPENLIDAALGEIRLSDDEPSASGGDDDVRVSATLHGGGGVFKQGAMRRVVVRFELSDGLHVYGEPVPEGMVPTSVGIEGPEGLVVEAPIFPPSETLHLESLDLELSVWTGVFDVAVPVYATAPFLSEVRPLEQTSAEIEVTVRYQACDDRTCLTPRTAKLTLEVPLAPVDVQSISTHKGHGQRESSMNSFAHMRRLLLRKVKAHPLRFARSMWRWLGLEREAKRRRRERA
jgi:peroxiredoxin